MTQTIVAEINLGALACSKLKSIYYPEGSWAKTNILVAERFTELKAVMRKAMPDKTSFQLVQELSKYTIEDIKDVIEV